MTCYTREIKSIDVELKRLNDRIKLLRTQKKGCEQQLYDYMVKHSLEVLDDIKIKKITPKPKVPRKGKNSKKSDAIKLFTEIGIPDPEDFWIQFQLTQKSLPPTQT